MSGLIDTHCHLDHTAGNIVFGPGASNAVGYFYTTGEIRTSGALSVTRGALATKDITWIGALYVAGDSAVWRDRAEGSKLKLPGMWP